jgi:lipoprotein-anchoring transpeptidase ErfK/SrfK
VAPARIAQVNDLRSWNAIRANQTLRIIKGRVSIVVDKVRFNMDVFLNGYFFKRYGVGLGRGGNTPTALTSVSRSMARNPSYTVPETGELISAKDQRNPIGTRWIGLEIGRGFGIHGTREPDSIGKESSNGCIRMINEDVEELYDYIMVGDEVDIR